MKKILVIKPSGIGDIVHSLPVAIGLSMVYPGSIIHWLVFSKFKEILYNQPQVNKIILWERNGGIKEYIRLVKELRKENYDLIIDLQVLLRTAVLGYLIKYKKVYSTSFVREFSNIFVKPVCKFDKEIHAVERNYQVVKFFANKENKNVPSPIELLPWIKVTEQENLAAKKMMEYNDNKKYVVVSAGSRGYHKIWPQEHFVELIQMLDKQFKNLVFIFVGSQNENTIIENIIKNLNYRVEFKNFVGKTGLREVAAIINNSNLTISNDNGVAHISAALDKPTVIIFGPSNPKWFYPYNKKSIYLYKPLHCSPCGVRTSCKDNVCMKQILPDEVFTLILEKLSIYLV